MADELDFKELQELAAEILGVDPEQVRMDVSFARDLAADSLDLVELIAAVEDKYDVELPEEELEKMKHVGDLWQFLLATQPTKSSISREPREGQADRARA
jgi:acyl carrier protein